MRMRQEGSILSAAASTPICRQAPRSRQKQLSPVDAAYARRQARRATAHIASAQRVCLFYVTSGFALYMRERPYDGLHTPRYVAITVRREQATTRMMRHLHETRRPRLRG